MAIRIAALDELPPGKGKIVHVGDRTITVYNVDGQLHATATRSPHRAQPAFGEADSTYQGLSFDVFAEDSPAELADAEACAVTVEDGVVLIELP